MGGRKLPAPRAELLVRLREQLEKGNSSGKACAIIGIGHDTYYAWARKYPEWRALRNEFRKPLVSIYGKTWIAGRN